MKSNSRRDFLKRCLSGSLGMASLTGLQLGLMTRARAAPVEGYKALVCVFLYGGNDSLNMLLPLGGDSLALYQAARQNLAVSGALPLAPLTAVTDGVGLHPALAPLQPLFASRRLALVGGVGSLIAPLSRDQVWQQSAALPRHLFSHNDQQATWMRGREPVTLERGWGAQMLELFAAEPDFASNISLAGTNLWQRGGVTAPFGMSTDGVNLPWPLREESGLSTAMTPIFAKLLEDNGQPLASAYARSNRLALDHSAVIRDALAQAPTLTTPFASDELGLQLRTVAQLISVQAQLGLGRQLFFVGMGGFDTHDHQNEVHPQLLATLASALTSFSDAMDELAMANQVTTFTMSDFGRTLSSNGDGTDHGWSGNQLVIGGAVQGGEIYGQLPLQQLDGSLDIGGGRLIPTTANEQYFATLGRWFGLSDGELLTLFPNLAHFNQTSLGFV